MSPTGHTAKSVSAPTPGLFATVAGLFTARGSGLSKIGFLFSLPALVAATLALTATPALAAGDANTASCPNEGMVGYSASLPDCRAYELVSPLYTNGIVSEPAAVSADGSELKIVSGGFGGTESFTGQSSYLVSRSAAGWSASALEPPASRFAAAYVDAFEFETGEALVETRTLQQSAYAEDLFVRAADGSLTEVGPMVPPAAEIGPPAGPYGNFAYTGELKYRGTSAGFGHVIISIDQAAPRWPGDTTTSGSSESIYEYSGRGLSHPDLVGVSDGSTQAVENGKTRRVPAGELISNCSTYLGTFEQHEVYNAISETGGSIIFTAEGHDNEHCEPATSAPEVTEVYARVDGQETVPISEPTSAACGVCSTPATVAEGRREGVFAGAARDGSKVFFLSNQVLLGKNSMNLYEYDFDGPPASGVHPEGKVRLLSTGAAEEENEETKTGGAKVLGVARVSEDGSHVYFVASGVLTGAEVNAEGLTAHEGENNLYVYQRDALYPAGKLSFVATLAAGDQQDWSSIDSRPVQASPDGRYLVFRSAADLTAGDAAPEADPQVFEYDAVTGELVRVSRGEARYASGVAAANSSEAYMPTQVYDEGFDFSKATTGLAVSDDGGTVVFQDVAGLTSAGRAAAREGVQSVYEYRSTGAIDAGEVYEVSDGADALASTFTNFAHGGPGSGFGTDGSGDDVFFETADSLVPLDSSTEGVLYDARVDGGLLPTVTPSPCAGEGCQGPAGSAGPAHGSGGTALAGGEAPLSPPSVAAPVKVAAPKKVMLLSSRERLAAALKACARKPRRKRARCEASARKRYAVKHDGGKR